jgi:outer membrane protein
MTKRAFCQILFGASLGLGAAFAHGADLWQVYRIAVESDPQLSAAQSAFRAAQEARPQARAGLLPQVSAGANWSQSSTNVESVSFPGGETGTTDFGSNGYSLTLAQPLFHWDTWVAQDQAQSLVARAEAQYQAAYQGLALRVAQAYFNVLAARDNLEFARAEMKALEQQLRQAEQRFEVGLSAITDVHEARARYDATVAQEIAARNQVDTAREALFEITGTSYDQLAPLQAEMPLVAPEPADIDRWVETAVNQNLQLLAAAAGAQAAGYEVNIRRAGHYPSVDLLASHIYSDASDHPTRGAEQSENALTLNLNIPIYQGGLVSSRVREAAHLHQQAKDQVEQQRRATIRQARDAYLNVAAGISRVRAANQAVASAQTALEATQAGFEVGTRTAVDVLDAQRELFRVRSDYARARYDYILSTLSLKQAAGTLAPEDMQAVNGWLVR